MWILGLKELNLSASSTCSGSPHSQYDPWFCKIIMTRSTMLTFYFLCCCMLLSFVVIAYCLLIRLCKNNNKKIVMANFLGKFSNAALNLKTVL